MSFIIYPYANISLTIQVRWDLKREVMFLTDLIFNPAM